MKTLTRSMVRHAHAIAREVGARIILLHADVVEEDCDLAALIEDVNFRVILVSRRQGFAAPAGWGELCSVVRTPDVPMTRTGQIKVAILVSAAEGLVHAGDRVLCLTGLDLSGTIDTVMVLDMGKEIELFSASTAEPLPGDVMPTVFERVLTLAGELGVEGREGRPVGTVFVIGDTDRVLAQSHQLVINPFHGYPEEERNILAARLEDTWRPGASSTLRCPTALAPATRPPPASPPCRRPWRFASRNRRVRSRCSRAAGWLLISPSRGGERLTRSEVDALVGR